MAFTRWLTHQYEQTIKDNRYDAEVDSWFLVNNLKTLIAIIALYLFFVLKAGPRMMENRKPFALKNLMLFYNLALSLYNAYVFIMLVPAAVGISPKHFCFPHPNKTSLPYSRVLYKSCWLFLVSKVIELLDTVFFVLRKKSSQVTILHVYHHSSTILNVWLYLRYLKSEQGIIAILLNSFVHVIMYMYYFLAACGPNVQKYLWWKRYITVMQLTQFGIVIVYLSLLLVMNCEVHRGCSLYMLFHTFVFLGMFLNFYRKAYGKKKYKTLKNAVVDNDVVNNIHSTVKCD